MNILKFTAKTIAVAGVVVTLAAAPSFALYSECVGEDTDYPELSTTQSKDYPIKCVTVTDGDATVTFYGKHSSDCAKAGTIAVAAGKKAATISDELAPKSFRIYKIKK